MLLPFHFFINVFEASCPMSFLMMRWHPVEFGVLFPHFWSHKPLLCPPWMRQVAQQTRKLMDGNLRIWVVAGKLTFSWTKGKKKATTNQQQSLGRITGYLEKDLFFFLIKNDRSYLLWLKSTISETWCSWGCWCTEIIESQNRYKTYGERLEGGGLV